MLWRFGVVSKKKKRFIDEKEGFNLDLTYIGGKPQRPGGGGSQLIAMGFPSEGMEALYRNSMSEVKRFFNERHADKFKIYNLCHEKAYALGDHFAQCERPVQTALLLIQLVHGA